MKWLRGIDFLGRDRYDVLLVLTVIALVASVGTCMALFSSRQIAHARVQSHSQHHAVVPAGAHTAITKPLVADYTLPPVVDGMAPVVTRIMTSQKVVFLTIDDGAYQNPIVISTLRSHQLKASLFLAKLFVGSNPQFFAQLTKQGSLIENHTISHDLNMVKDMNYDQQRAEICGMADYEQSTYGRRPEYYRPPGGAYSDIMRRAAHDCGMKAVVTWMVTVNNGSLQYQIGNKLRPGDIVLMHFRPTFVADVQAFVEAAKATGLRPELLENAISHS